MTPKLPHLLDSLSGKLKLSRPIQRIQQQVTRYLFVNAQGVMLRNGAICLGSSSTHQSQILPAFAANPTILHPTSLSTHQAI